MLTSRCPIVEKGRTVTGTAAMASSECNASATQGLGVVTVVCSKKGEGPKGERSNSRQDGLVEALSPGRHCQVQLRSAIAEPREPPTGRWAGVDGGAAEKAVGFTLILANNQCRVPVQSPRTRSYSSTLLEPAGSRSFSPADSVKPRIYMFEVHGCHRCSVPHSCPVGFHIGHLVRFPSSSVYMWGAAKNTNPANDIATRSIGNDAVLLQHYGFASPSPNLGSSTSPNPAGLVPDSLPTEVCPTECIDLVALGVHTGLLAS